MQISTGLELKTDSMSKITQIGPTKVQILLGGKAFLLHFISEIWKIIFCLFPHEYQKSTAGRQAGIMKTKCFGSSPTRVTTPHFGADLGLVTSGL